jgi:hypothetical protein
MLQGKAVALIDSLFLEAEEINLSLMMRKKMMREKEKTLIEVDQRKRELLSY